MRAGLAIEAADLAVVAPLREALAQAMGQLSDRLQVGLDAPALLARREDDHVIGGPELLTAVGEGHREERDLRQARVGAGRAVPPVRHHEGRRPRDAIGFGDGAIGIDDEGQMVGPRPIAFDHFGHGLGVAAREDVDDLTHLGLALRPRLDLRNLATTHRAPRRGKDDDLPRFAVYDRGPRMGLPTQVENAELSARRLGGPGRRQFAQQQGQSERDGVIDAHHHSHPAPALPPTPWSPSSRVNPKTDTVVVVVAPPTPPPTGTVSKVPALCI